MIGRLLKSLVSCEDRGFFIYGYFGAGNIGDELILTAFLSMLEKKGYCKRIVISTNVGDSSYLCRILDRFCGLKIEFAARSKFALSFCNISAFMKSDAFVIPGGGIFQDYNALSFLCYYSFLIAAEFFGLKRYLLYQGFTGIKRPFFKKLLSHALLRIIDFASVRDERSAAFIDYKSARRLKKQQFFADPVFSLKSDLKSATDNAGSTFNNALGMSLRAWRGFSAKEAAAALDEIVKSSGRKIVLYSMQKSIDCDFLLALTRESVAYPQGKISIFEYTDDLQALAGSLSKNFLNIGMRFHFCVISAMIGVPVIGISYDDKVSELFKQVNLQQLCIFNIIEERKKMASEIIKKINYAVSNYDGIKKRFALYSDAQESAAFKLFDDFYNSEILLKH